jgi:hypothetical protein
MGVNIDIDMDAIGYDAAIYVQGYLYVLYPELMEDEQDYYTPTVQWMVTNIIEHEIGHALGLEDTTYVPSGQCSEVQSFMYPVGYPRFFCNQPLSEDDASFMNSTLYPATQKECEKLCGE